MFLEDYTKDFVALIEFLNAEAAWERSDRFNNNEAIFQVNFLKTFFSLIFFRPTAIAWEIRKTVGSPNKPYNNNVYNENQFTEKKINVDNKIKS